MPGVSPGEQDAPGEPNPAAAHAVWATVVERAAAAALAMFTPGRPVRLLGVRAEFADNPR